MPFLIMVFKFRLFFFFCLVGLVTIVGIGCKCIKRFLGQFGANDGHVSGLAPLVIFDWLGIHSTTFILQEEKPRSMQDAHSVTSRMIIKPFQAQ